MVDPDLVVIISGIFLTVVGYQLALAVRRHVERPALAPPDLTEIRRRLDEIGQTVEAIAIEVERVSEAQRFSARLLAERVDRPSGPPDPQRLSAGGGRKPPEHQTPH